MARAPEDTITIRRLPAGQLPAVGGEIWIKAKVTRTGRNRYDTADTVTLRIADHPSPITATAKYLQGDDEE